VRWGRVLLRRLLGGWVGGGVQGRRRMSGMSGDFVEVGGKGRGGDCTSSRF
jgi:hypothetical protein